MATLNLYIGAKKIHPELSGTGKTDFGAGIRLFDKPASAREVACLGASDGYISRYELETRGLKILDLCERKRGILPWLALFLENRAFRVNSGRAAEAVKKIVSGSYPDTDGFDAIIGYCADGSAFSAVRAYLEGDISLEKLGTVIGGRGCPKQTVLKTDSAIGALRFTAYASVKAVSYYPRSMSRDFELRRSVFENGSYSSELQKNLGEAFDYATGVCDINPARFIEMLNAAGITDRLDAREPGYIAGASGTEWVIDAVTRAGIEKAFTDRHAYGALSDEYRLGERIAYYSEERGISLRSIFNTVTFEEFRNYSSASMNGFTEALDALIAEKSAAARLQEQRKLRGMSQRELAEASGVNLRTLQQYELKTKDINKASAVSVISLAKVLGCRAEDILELNK